MKRTQIDQNLTYIDKYVTDPILRTLLKQKYQHVKANSINANALKLDIITHVLPIVDRYIEKRYRFTPEKREDLYSMISSLKDAFTKDNKISSVDEFMYEEEELPLEYYQNPEAYVEKEYEKYEQESASAVSTAATGVVEEAKGEPIKKARAKGFLSSKATKSDYYGKA